MSRITVETDAARYETEDDCLTAAASDLAEALGLQGWDLSPRWSDEQREAIRCTVPASEWAPTAATQWSEVE